MFVLSVVPVEPRVAIPYLDKVAHGGEYLVFAWLLVQAMRASGGREPAYLLWAWMSATSYGLLMELVQAMIPWRCAEFADAVANAVGAAIGVWIGNRTL